MKATDRHKQRVAELIAAPMDEGVAIYDDDGDENDEVFYGEGAMDFIPGLLNAGGEIAKSEIAKKDAADAKKKLESGEAFKAQAAANEAQKKAAFAQADAVTEADPNGPKHRMAADLAKQAQAASAKASYLAMQSGGGAMVPAGYVPPSPSFFTPRNVAIGGAVVLGLGLVVYLARRK